MKTKLKRTVPSFADFAGRSAFSAAFFAFFLCCMFLINMHTITIAMMRTKNAPAAPAIVAIMFTDSFFLFSFSFIFVSKSI